MLKPYVAYEASAGSGKTFTLSVRYASLLFHGIRPEKILVLTFTNKAANEMRIRILELLSGLEEKDAELNEICSALDIDKKSLLDMKERVLERFLKSEHKIMTIDSFLNLIVRNFSLYAGLSPDFTIAKTDPFLLQKGFLKAIRANEKWDELLWLAISENKKMKDLFLLFGFLYEKEVELPKGRKSAGTKSKEIEKEALKVFAGLADMVTSSDSAGDMVKKMVSFSDISDIAKKTWIDRESLRHERSYFNKCYAPEMDDMLHDVQRLLGLFFKAKEEESLSRLLSLYDIYKDTIKRIKSSKAQLDFTDMTNTAASLLKGLDSEFLYFRLDGKIEHLLIDEFQDTSIAQYRILEPIIEEIRSGIGTGDGLKSFFYVGDVKQSIYRFRGGNSELFGYVKERYNIELEHLKTNYRSSANVVGFINGVFKERIEGYIPQEIKKGAVEGSAGVVESEDIEASLMGEIKRLHNKGVAYEKIAVLVFTNNEVIDVKERIREELGGGVPIVTDSSKRVIFQSDVKALIELLKYLYFEKEIFGRNFCSLSCSDKMPEISEYRGLLHLPFIQLVHLLVKDFGLFKDDANLLKFIEVCGSFKDAEEFIYAYELLDIPMLKGSHEGLRILTIHKSKGLEFDHVIVMDKKGRENSSADSLIFGYDGIELNSISRRFADRQKFDREYAAILDEEKRLSQRDVVNTLYVAFTRARESLCVIKKAKSSSFEIIGLKECRIGDITGKNDTLQKDGIPRAKTVEYKEQSYGRQKLDVKKEKKREDFDFEALDTGLGLHYALEMLDGFETEGIEDAMTAVRNRFVMDDHGYDRIGTMLHTILNDSRFKTLVKGEVYKERSFIIEKELGIIDLYVIDGDEIRVIDYKTGSKNESYKEQVKKYMDALKRFYPEKKISGYLCYISQNIDIQRVLHE